MTNLSSWKTETINQIKQWRRYRKDGTKKVTVTFCAYHERWIVIGYLIPRCKCTAPVAMTYDYPSQRTAKLFATNWLKY